MALHACIDLLYFPEPTEEYFDYWHGFYTGIIATLWVAEGRVQFERSSLALPAY